MEQLLLFDPNERYPDAMIDAFLEDLEAAILELENAPVGTKIELTSPDYDGAKVGR